MENLDNKVIDANGNEIVLTEDDFKFVQQDKKIKDKNFDTKPTTFFKDAIGRFRKSKSSVVAFVIIGVLMLLSIIVPAVSPYNDFNNPYNAYMVKMSPKLFSNGTFWSGLRTYSDQPYDLLNDTYGSGDSGFNKEYISNATFDYTKSNANSSSNLGGVFLLVSSSKTKDSVMTFKNGVNIGADTDLIMTLDITNDEAALASIDATFGSYSVELVDSNGNTLYTLLDTTSNTGEITINVGDIVTSDVEGALFRIKLVHSETTTACLPIQGISFTTSDETLNSALEVFSIKKDKYALDTNAFNSDESLTDEEAKTYLDTLKTNSAVIQARNYSKLYTLGRSKPAIYGAIAAVTTFKYDEYASKLGNQTYTITQSDMAKYVANGWCEFTYDSTTKEYTFKQLSDSCPIKNVSSVKTVSQSYEVIGEVCMYQYYGFTSMPRFIFGTDGQGRDMFSYAFYALRTSLIIAFIVTAINFIVGIIYGSIEGYFGGNVDLFMERISDILGYLPTTILITLLFLNYGKSLFIFGLGMTLTGWLGVASRTRTQFYRFKGREYVLASRTLGASDARLIFKHVLPNSLGTLITTSILMVPGTISVEATLSYIGLGLEGTASFGVVMSDNQQNLLTNPHLVLFPAVIMSLLMISFNLFGNGLRDAFNPSLKGSE